MALRELEISNFKKITNFNQEFNGDVWLFTGDNELGKSTIIQSIFTLMGMERSENLLTEGKEKGFVKGKFEQDGTEYQIELRFTKKNKRGTLKVTEVGGLLESNKVSVLHKIFGYRDFDISEFIGWSNSKPGKRKQVDFIKSLLPADAQSRITEIDLEIQTLNTNKLEIDSEIKTSKAIVDNYGIDVAYLALYTEPKPLEPFKKRIKKSTQRNQQIKEVADNNIERKEKLDNWDEYFGLQMAGNIKEIENIQNEVNGLQQLLDKAKQKLAELQKENIKISDDLKAEHEKEESTYYEHNEWLKEHKPDPIEVINAELEEAIQHNEKSKKIDEYKISFKKFEAEKEESEKLITSIETLESERKVIVSKNPLPVKGLSFDQEQLYLNGIPFAEDEVSTSQIMETCITLMIHINPKCKMFKIGRGESLGADKFKSIIEFAKEKGFQGFIEEMHRGQKELNVFEYHENE